MRQTPIKLYVILEIELKIRKMKHDNDMISHVKMRKIYDNNK